MWSTVWHRRIYDITLFILLFAIPGLFIIISYALIGHQLWVEDVLLHGRKKSPENNRILVRSRQTTKILSGRRRLARMLGAIAAAFAICWMPYQLLR
jgi:7 transmembrane receptor (rhodopsin family)